jgi:hypothetical protein
MEINIGDRFVRDTRYGRISYTVTDMEYKWGPFGNLEETVCYTGEGPPGTYSGNATWKKPKTRFEEILSHFSVRRIPKGEIGDIQTYIPRHQFR